MARIVAEPTSVLGDLAQIPNAFRVTSILEISENGDGFGLNERPVAAPYVKDYDGLYDNDPAAWSRHFDVSNWAVFGAWEDAGRVGSVVIAWNSPAVHMLEERSDLGVVWDLRVRPEARGQGIGTQLFASAERWMVGRGCTLLKVETQNVNVPACRFYARMGCRLGGINRFAYPDLPDETQLLWYKVLT